MGEARLTKREIALEFLRGRNCAQCVLGAYADDLGYDREETDRMTACFGGGMEMGHTCGAVTGALMVIGMACKDPAAGSKAFRERFTELHGTCLCGGLLDCDFSSPESVAEMQASGKMTSICPGFVEDALSILDDILEDAL